MSSTNSSVSSGALPLYGITNAGGDPIIFPDSVVEVDISADSNLNTHPVEQGGFSAYNRVQEPVSVRLMLACQGKNQTRDGFISTLDSLREGTQIVTISTPDASYPNMVLKGYGYKKTAERGAVTIWADTQWVEERSANVTISAPATSQPQGAAVKNLGSLQPQPLTPQQYAIVNGSLVDSLVLPPFSYSGTGPPSGAAF